jgi:hypothetical protein
MTDFIRILVPIVWAVLSTAVALALYRYSSTKVETKWVVLTGAASTFAVTFFLLFKATPASLLTSNNTAAWQNVQIELDQISAAVSSLRDQCLGKNQLDCEKAIERLQTALAGARSVVIESLGESPSLPH